MLLHIGYIAGVLMGSVDPKSLEVDSKIKYLEKVAVIKNYYLVIGEGESWYLFYGVYSKE